MIFDCFTFLNELDLLEIRLRELYDTVDYFVLVEAPITFSGNPKPLYYEDNKQRFKQWSAKIIHVIPTDLPTGPNAWEREDASREHFKVAIDNFNGNWRLTRDDIITICDVDEIPRASALRLAAELKIHQASLHLRDYRYKANLRFRFDCYGPKVVNGEFFNANTVIAYFHQYSTCNPTFAPCNAVPKAPVSDSAEPAANSLAARLAASFQLA